MSKYIVDILDKDKYALEIGITKNGSPASQRVLDAVKVGIPYVERPHGEWICKGAVGDGTWCSSCDAHFSIFPNRYKFCPMCGADMRGEE